MIEQARREHPALSVVGLCELLGVSRSWYYARPRLEETAQCDVEIRDSIERIVLEFPGYGYRRVIEQLRREEWDVNHMRVLRIMRDESFLRQLKRRFVVTTDSRHGLRTYTNLLGEAALDGLDQAWVSDITCIRLPQSFVYLAAIPDAYSRRCIDWALSRWIDTRSALQALTTARGSRRSPRVYPSLG